MSFRLFVGNLPYDSDETEITGLFSKAGQVTNLSMPVDRETGKRRGFAFVEFAEKAQADEAIRIFSNQPFKGRNLIVNEARARESRPLTSSRASSSPRAPMGGNSGRSFQTFRDDGMGMNQPEREQRRNRKFGPDAKPTRGREPWNRKQKSEGGRKGPIPIRRGGQFFSADDDNSPDDEDLLKDSYEDDELDQ
ncbi:MAG: splicing factor, CC1-like family [Acidobacteria bacterium]|jgi:RNA recognition motif-containing protein|nr:splicing factor, CC1-like family [Acidobacteriota bacterium]